MTKFIFKNILLLIDGFQRGSGLGFLTESTILPEDLGGPRRKVSTTTATS